MHVVPWVRVDVRREKFRFTHVLMSIFICIYVDDIVPDQVSEKASPP